MSRMSSLLRPTRCSSRSNGPSKISVLTVYAAIGEVRAYSGSMCDEAPHGVDDLARDAAARARRRPRAPPTRTQDARAELGAALPERREVGDEVLDQLLLVRDAAAFGGAAARVPLGDLGPSDAMSLWIWCSGQMSGSPGSVFSLRAGSVIIDMTLTRISSGVSEMKIALP